MAFGERTPSEINEKTRRIQAKRAIQLELVADETGRRRAKLLMALRNRRPSGRSWRLRGHCATHQREAR